MTRPLSVVALLVLALAPVARAQQPDTVPITDLSIVGVRFDSDTAAERTRLGAPLQAHVAEQTNDDGVLVTTWSYPDLRIDFDGKGQRYAAMVQGPRYRTTRGVAVGDSVAKVRRLYGRPLHENATAILYAASTKAFETRGISFLLKNGRVSEIIVGNVISVE